MLHLYRLSGTNFGHPAENDYAAARENGTIGIYRKEEAAVKKSNQFSIRKKLLLLSLSVALPFLCMVIYLLMSMANYSESYGKIVTNLTIANNYNLNFKEEMDESLYKLVVGYVTFDTISSDRSLKDPYVLIEELRSEFTKLNEVTTEAESRVWLESLLRNIDTLEDRVRDVEQDIESGTEYSVNIEGLDNNIYILTELIQDDIQYYIYYQTRSMERVNEKLNERIKQFYALMMVAVGIMIILVAIITFFMVRSITRPIRELDQVTKRVAEGDFTARAHVNSHDEIEVLANGFNNMAENMEALLVKMKEDEGKLRRMDLRLLQEQINPHFLYNTLDTIVWLIEGEENQKAVDMVVTLSQFFRIVLSKGKEHISILDEELYIKSYLEIQSVRYGDIMEYDIQMDKVLYEYQILKLTLQPIVENALYHGLKYKRAKGYIHISGQKENDVIRFTVRDNGVGMDAEELEKLRETITKPCQETTRGFGLANVNERIRMYFGNEYGMTIQSEKGIGTTVEIVIPAIRIREQEEKAKV